MSAGDDPVRLGDAMVLRMTPKALLVQLTDADGDELWVPLSVIHDNSEVFDNDKNSAGQLVVKRWYAEKNKLL